MSKKEYYEFSNLVKLTYKDGKLDEEILDSPAINPSTEMIVFQDRKHRPIKYSSLYELNFSKHKQLQMIVDVNFVDSAKKWLMKRVDRLAKKGLVSKSSRKSLHIIHTSCKDCVNAVYEGDTQTGCSFNNRVNEYKKKGNILEAYDNEKEFFIVNETKCLANRDKKWLEDKTFGHMSKNFRISLEIEQKVDIIIPVFEGFHEAYMSDTLFYLKNQKLKPNKISIVIKKEETISSSKIHNYLRNYLKGSGINWELVNIIDSLDKNEAIDSVVRKSNAHFYSVIYQGTQLETDFIKNISDEVVCKLSKTKLYLPKENGNGLTVALSLHKHELINGHSKYKYKDKIITSIPEKVKILIKGIEYYNLVAPVGKIWH